MTTFLLLLAFMAPIAACIVIPILMKKKGKGKNGFVRFLSGIGCAIVLFLIFLILAYVSDRKKTIFSTETLATDSLSIQTNDNDEKQVFGFSPTATFEQFAYYKRDPSGDFNYRIFVYITDASFEDMEEHAKKQTWSSHGTTMVCYFRSSVGLNSDAINLAKDVDAATKEIWKPTLVAQYVHWPTGKELFTENPYEEEIECISNKAKWTESTSKDEMTDETNVWSTLTSDNVFEFQFPYDGGSRLTINVRYRKQDGNQVILSINKGQLLPSDYNGNNVVVRFDDDAPMTFTTKESADYNSNLLFLNNPQKFINKAKTAKKIKIQVPVFEEGQPLFQFEPAEPLRWNK